MTPNLKPQAIYSWGGCSVLTPAFSHTWAGQQCWNTRPQFYPFSSQGLAVGLDPEGYGNPDFCWISVHEPLIWSFAGPIVLVIVVSALDLLPLLYFPPSWGRGAAVKSAEGSQMAFCRLPGLSLHFFCPLVSDHPHSTGMEMGAGGQRFSRLSMPLHLSISQSLSGSPFLFL